MMTLSVISWENNDNPLLFSLATKVTGLVPISATIVGAAVNVFPVPNRFVPVYPIFVAAILSHHVDIKAELCIVMINGLPSISDIVNL